METAVFCLTRPKRSIRWRSGRHLILLVYPPSSTGAWLSTTRIGRGITTSFRPCINRCAVPIRRRRFTIRSEEHTSELQSLMRISYAVFCLKKKKKQYNNTKSSNTTTKQYNQHLHV